MDRDDPREWFYALMDYGVWVKKEYGNPSRRSKHHAVQSRFAGLQAGSAGTDPACVVGSRAGAGERE